MQTFFEDDDDGNYSPMEKFVSFMTSSYNGDDLGFVQLISRQVFDEYNNIQCNGILKRYYRSFEISCPLVVLSE